MFGFGKDPHEKLKDEFKGDYYRGHEDGTSDGTLGLHGEFYDKGYSEGMTEIHDEFDMYLEETENW